MSGRHQAAERGPGLVPTSNCCVNASTLTSGGRTNVWDSQNRLVSCTYNGNTSTFTYAADGLRRSLTAGGVTTDFVLDGQNVIQELRGGTVYATYLTGARGVEYRLDASGQVKWYLYDGLGSVIGEVDENGNVTATRKYDVYGAVRGSTGDSDSNHKFVGGLGHTSENETGLIYMRARYYDPVTGRFVSEDSARNGNNWYAYCNNNPVGLVDGSGKEPGSFNHYVFLAVMWYALPLPFVDNPYLRPALEAFVGFAPVDQYWVDQLSANLGGYHAVDAANVLSIASMIAKEALKRVAPAIAALTAVTAYRFAIEVALVGVDIAFVEGR